MKNKLLLDYKDLLFYDLNFHRDIPYDGELSTPIHRWYLIPESPSIKWAQVLMEEAESTNYKYVFNPFVGSGTIALQAVYNQKSFIGGDKLADLVLATMAKVSFSQLMYEEFSDIAKLLINFIEDKLILSESINPKTSLSYLYNFFTSIQNFVLSVNTSNSSKFALITAIYNTIRTICTSKESNFNFKAVLLTSLDNIQNDLIRNEFRSGTINWKINYGDSTRVNWGKYLADMLPTVPEKGLLFTSPTYVQSSQDRSEYSKLLDQLGEKALEELGFWAKTTEPEIEILLPPEINSLIEQLPKPIHSYLNALSKVLISFKSIAVSSSWTLVANENPRIENEHIDLDLIVCMLADTIGYAPKRIRVTHYMERPGVITTKPTGRRGSVIYLELR